MKSFAELRKQVQREKDAGKRDRVTPTQWRTQLLATVQLAAALGLHYSGRVTKTGEVYRVETVEIPDGWHPVDFDLPWRERVKAFQEFPLHSVLLQQIRREQQEQLARWEAEDARDRRVKEKRERERPGMERPVG